ncbi:Dot/Icm T4SS effector Wip [Legionella fallonii]|uniref:WipA-like phosphatase domain-containing protein n=1 Tax=Legionella fallonii LLAP-10 TaxID=1212491 RepID=A0A098FZJ1_9GAMM|nr:Dot/Icm T4SS effector Wip [Legionella fallonii]CEG55648.1 protein of unknown function [Legionella fallonii LLAP-10]
MPHVKIEKEVNIYNYPRAEPTGASEIAIGDLHANAVLLMFFLQSNGIVNISAADYQKLVDIYRKDKHTKEDIKQFNQIIDALQINEKTLVRLIGDEICDRGQNDYFIFKILQKLKKHGVPVEIMLSNHGIEFLIPYEQGHELYAPNIDLAGQARSLNNLRQLITDGVIDKQEVDELVAEAYLPNLKLISYSLEANNITIYSHAGIGLEVIESLARKFKDDGVVYKDDTAEDLARTIDAINAVFAKHIAAGTVHTLPVHLTSASDPQGDPISFLLWNRFYHGLNRNKEHKGYNVYYVHGHDSGELSHDNIFNLDSSLGKPQTPNIGTHKALGVSGTMPKLQNQHANVNIVPVKTEPAYVADIANPFLSQLHKLKSKANELHQNGHTEAYTSAMEIHSKLEKAYRDLKGNHNIDNFRAKCTDVIAKQRPVLDKHRGWSEFLVNLVLLISTAGIGLLIKGAINVANNKSFFFVHKTQSTQIVDDLQSTIENNPSSNSPIK